MTLLAQLQTRAYKLDRRFFAFFLLLQAVILVAVLLEQQKFLYMALAAGGVGFFGILLVFYPWIVVPVIVSTTALDITGQLIKTTAVGVPLTGFHIAFILMIIALVLNIWLRQREEFPVFELKGPLLMFLAVMAVSLTYSPNQPEATIYFTRTTMLVVFLYLTQVMIDSRQAVNMVLYSMVIAIIGGSIMGAWQVITGEFHLPASMVQSLGANVPRATATFHNPNIFGAFLMSGVIPLLGILLNCRIRWWQQSLIGVACLVGFLGILATFSRSNWVSIAVGVLVVLWLGKKLRYLFSFIFVALLALVALKEFVPFAAYIFDRFTSIFTFFEEFGAAGQASSTTRVYLAMACFDMFMDHPILGVGWRAFPVLFTEYAPPGYPFWTLVDESHTVLTTILAELGFIGMVAALWFIGRTLRIGITEVDKMQDPYLRGTLIGLVAVFIAFQVNQSFNGDFSNNIYWFYVGMLFAVIRLDKQARAA